MQVLMAELPDDLVALPTTPYDKRPESMPLDREEIRTALWLTRGNVTKASEIIKVSSKRLRSFIDNSPYLLSEMKEATEQLLDVAVDNVYDALTDGEDATRRDQMSRFVLTQLGGDRGFAKKNEKGGLTLNMPGRGRMTVSWEDGTTINDNSAKQIEGEVVSN